MKKIFKVIFYKKIKLFFSYISCVLTLHYFNRVLFYFLTRYHFGERPHLNMTKLKNW